MNFIRKGYYERMDKKENSKMTPLQFVFRVVQGALIGLGAVLPGISGGVLSVIFGIYKPIMELLSNPIANFKTRKFDSSINQKTLTGPIKPVFFCQF